MAQTLLALYHVCVLPTINHRWPENHSSSLYGDSHDSAWVYWVYETMDGGWAGGRGGSRGRDRGAEGGREDRKRVTERERERERERGRRDGGGEGEVRGWVEGGGGGQKG